MYVTFVVCDEFGFKTLQTIYTYTYISISTSSRQYYISYTGILAVIIEIPYYYRVFISDDYIKFVYEFFFSVIIYRI